MKTVNLAALNGMDHEDIKDAATTESQRRKIRIKLIKQFLSWARAVEQKDKFSNRENHEEY